MDLMYNLGKLVGKLAGTIFTHETIMVMPLYLILASFVSNKILTNKAHLKYLFMNIGFSIISGAVLLLLKWEKITIHYSLINYPKPKFVNFLFFPTIGSFIILILLTYSFIFFRNRKKSINKNTENKTAKKPKRNFKSSLNIKKYFQDEKYFKLFILLQMLFILIIIFYDIQSYWNIADLFENFGKNRYITGNSLAITTIFLPVFLSKGLDWIFNKNNK